MRTAGRIACIVIAIALLAGAIYAAIRASNAALTYLALALLAGMFERLLAAGGGK